MLTSMRQAECAESLMCQEIGQQERCNLGRCMVRVRGLCLAVSILKDYGTVQLGSLALHKDKVKGLGIYVNPFPAIYERFPRTH